MTNQLDKPNTSFKRLIEQRNTNPIDDLTLRISTKFPQFTINWQNCYKYDNPIAGIRVQLWDNKDDRIYKGKSSPDRFTLNLEFRLKGQYHYSEKLKHLASGVMPFRTDIPQDLALEQRQTQIDRLKGTKQNIAHKLAPDSPAAEQYIWSFAGIDEPINVYDERITTHDAQKIELINHVAKSFNDASLSGKKSIPKKYRDRLQFVTFKKSYRWASADGSGTKTNNIATPIMGLLEFNGDIYDADYSCKLHLVTPYHGTMFGDVLTIDLVTQSIENTDNPDDTNMPVASGILKLKPIKK